MSTDSETIAASFAEPRVFGVLFARHALTVHRYISRRAGSDTADEVLSETFLTAFERRDRFDLSFESARPWLLGIATVLLRAHHRQEARHLRAMSRAATEEGHDGGIGRATEVADATSGVARLRTALAAMPPGDRDVLLLYAWADLTYDQIAGALNLPIGTVRSRLSRTRKNLRESAAVTISEEAEHGRSDAAATA